MTLTPRLERYVRARFDADAAETIVERLRGWRISYLDRAPSERLTAAVVLVAEADGLGTALSLASSDWRDLLVAAGLEHADWPKVLRRTFGD